VSRTWERDPYTGGKVWVGEGPEPTSPRDPEWHGAVQLALVVLLVLLVLWLWLSPHPYAPFDLGAI
jgi:hypothetical protein